MEKKRRSNPHVNPTAFTAFLCICSLCRAVLLNLSIADVLGWITLCLGEGGAVVCFPGCLRASLVPTHQMPGALPQTLPNVPLRQQCLWWRTTNSKTVINATFNITLVE